MGKTTLAEEVVRLARQDGRTVTLLDGDVMRRVWGDNLGHMLEVRKKTQAVSTRGYVNPV